MAKIHDLTDGSDGPVVVRKIPQDECPLCAVEQHIAEHVAEHIANHAPQPVSSSRVFDMGGRRTKALSPEERELLRLTHPFTRPLTAH